MLLIRLAIHAEGSAGGEAEPHAPARRRSLILRSARDVRAISRTRQTTGPSWRRAFNDVGEAP